MLDTRETVVQSIDDPWLDEQTYWSLAEKNAVSDIVDAVNTSHLVPGQTYHLQIVGADDESFAQGSVVLTATCENGPDEHCLQHLADGICRLIRPSRYYGFDPHDPEREIWSQVFITPKVSAHERLSTVTSIPRLAGLLGRTDFGIEAALAELRGWADAPHPQGTPRLA